MTDPPVGEHALEVGLIEGQRSADDRRDHADLFEHDQNGNPADFDAWRDERVFDSHPGDDRDLGDCGSE